MIAEKGATALLQRSFRLFSTLDEACQWIIDNHNTHSRMRPCKRWTFGGRGFRVFEFKGPGKVAKRLTPKDLEKSAIYQVLPENYV